MKRYFLRFTSFILSALVLTAFSQKAMSQEVVVSYQTFYDDLSPYGQWVSDPEYGNVWVPNEDAGYRPYASGGHWAMTEYGNMWVSDAPYGWACYHYGRWTYNPYYGWVWIPGHEWAPAWVSWRSGGGYYGWAPMGPGYVAGGAYDYPENYWTFVGPEYLYDPYVYNYYGLRRSSFYIGRTTYINETYIDNGSHTTYYYGPRREAIERETHQPVQVYHVSNARSSGITQVRGDEVTVYRPSVNHESVRSARPANVREAPQPIGRPQEITRREENRQPQFRKEMRKENPVLRNPSNTWNSRGNEQGQYQGRDQGQSNMQQQGRGERPSNRRFENNPARNESQPGRGMQQQTQQDNRPSRGQPQWNRPQATPQQGQPQGGSRPQMQNQPQGGRPQMQQQVNRPQPQQNQQPATRPQPQTKPQAQPADDNKRGRR